MTLNSLDLYEPGKCSQCGNAISDHGPPYGLCDAACEAKYDAARHKCPCCGGYDCPLPFCKTLTEPEGERDGL
jgi:hypothetical protein